MGAEKKHLLSGTVLGAAVIGAALSLPQAASAGTQAQSLDNPTAIARPADAGVRLAACKACNPCAAKKACNPCNPCAAKKACNPCNPCAAKKACNPCNPCAAKKACNPCAPKK